MAETSQPGRENMDSSVFLCDDVRRSQGSFLSESKFPKYPQSELNVNLSKISSVRAKSFLRMGYFFFFYFFTDLDLNIVHVEFYKAVVMLLSV